jgi:hypothetical protein
MRRVLVMIVMVLLAASAFCQSSSAKYQLGTIMAVKPHPEDSATHSSATRYDVSIKVGAGRELLVLVGDKTLTFNDMLDNSRKVPIISRTTVPIPSSQ